MSVPVGVIRLPHADGLPLPGYATDQSAGMDLIAAGAIFKDFDAAFFKASGA